MAFYSLLHSLSLILSFKGGPRVAVYRGGVTTFLTSLTPRNFFHCKQWLPVGYTTISVMCLYKDTCLYRIGRKLKWHHLVPGSPGTSRQKTVQWADWELRNVMDFDTAEDINLIDDEVEINDVENKDTQVGGELPLANSLVQTSLEISSLVSRSSRSASETTCTTFASIEEDDERQAALSDLITHLEDTAALLREYLQPPKPDIEDADYTSYEQTIFLLKYLLVLVSFIQLVSILLLTLFDHILDKDKETAYIILTRSCGTTLQILNMLLVSFATIVLSRQMLKYKVEGKFMAQTYLATVITFAGLYFIIYRFKPDSWEFGSIDKMEDNIAASQYIRMLYLSVSAATLCGAANIQPRYWYVILILCFQSLINFVYFASILAQTIGNYHSYTVQVVRRNSSMSHTRSKTYDS